VTRSASPSIGLSLLAAAAILAGCGTTASPTPAATLASSASPSPSLASPSAASPTVAASEPSASASATSQASIALPSQTETEWGRIWDELPPTFPVFPGQAPTETGEGPFSAQLSVPGDPAAAATWYQGALEVVGLSTLSMSGPLEDGSYVIESTGDPEGCVVETRLAPHGDVTLVSVLFGAACPFR